MSKVSLCDSGHCHSCGSKRAEVKASYTNRIELYDFSATTHYSILQCGGCGEIYSNPVHRIPMTMLKV